MEKIGFKFENIMYPVPLAPRPEHEATECKINRVSGVLRMYDSELKAGSVFQPDSVSWMTISEISEAEFNQMATVMAEGQVKIDQMMQKVGGKPQ